MSPRLRLPLLAFLVAVLLGPPPAEGSRQAVALFPPEIVGEAGPVDAAALSRRLGEGIREKLQDQFDLRSAGEGGLPGDDPGRVRKARALGAAYLVTGSLARIGRAVTLDLTIAPVEDLSRKRTIVVTAVDARREGEAGPPGAADNTAAPGGELPVVYRQLITDAAAKLKLAFFGDEVLGEGASRRTIPRPAGVLTRSRNLEGEVVSVAWADTDRDGRMEVIAASPDAVNVYRVEEDDLVLTGSIPISGSELVHVDAADLDRDGFAEIVAVRYVAGRAASEIWEYDGKAYRKTAADVAFFLRAVDLGEEGIVLVAQEADPRTVFRGPVFRFAPDGSGPADRPGGRNPLPLPAGTGIYAFVPLRSGGERRFAVLREDGRLELLDTGGRILSTTPEAVGARESFLDPAASLPEAMSNPGGEASGRRHLPVRLFAVDLDGDRKDEVVASNNLLAAGGFFENIRVYADAEILAFAQDGDGLRLAWRTALVGGSARDAFVEGGGSGKPFRIGIASRDRGKMLGRFGEWRLLWLK